MVQPHKREVCGRDELDRRWKSRHLRPNNNLIWQSFDYPTDTLLVGQELMRGQRLTSRVSASNQSEGLFYFSQDKAGLVGAYIKSDPPQNYYLDNSTAVFPFLELTNNSFIDNLTSSEARFIKLGPDGHLRPFQWSPYGWTEGNDLLSYRSCVYPTVCGKYGVCSDNHSYQCSCLETSDQGDFFKQIVFGQPNLGCSPRTPISCDHSRDHTLLELNHTYYFAFPSAGEEISVEECKNRCLSNCFCKAAVVGKTTRANVTCLLLNEVFSIANNHNYMASDDNTTMYIKVQMQHSTTKASRRGRTIIIASTLAAVFGVLSVIGSNLVLCWIWKNKQLNETEEDFLDYVPGMPTRYSYENLKVATDCFRIKLGEGGFGSVYEGELSDGTKIAVKCLDGLAKVKDSFLVEVKALGSIHHVNLVKLVGFCFEKSHRLLVYEYMANRSLDGWIFLGKEDQYCLPWHARRKIISDIAKGLAYLHEDCSQKIIHLDIKPQNVLLDQNLNAKISDFGLSKLIEKDQSRVVTTMRGTPGYMAPEWLSSIITEKVDVYSFGIVMLEIICGRKNLDWSKTEEERHLLSVFKRKAEEKKLEELVDSKSEDMVIHIEEAVEMMGIAAWCLQDDFAKRPSMSLVVKVLEGLVAAETDLDYDFLNPAILNRNAAADPWHTIAPYGATELTPLALSGAR